jgi:hypothetical protein
MKVIGIGGYARCGKDTFVSLARESLTKNGFHAERVAFADQLKIEVKEMLKKNNFELDVYTTEQIPKTKLRPLLVWWGCTRRDLSEDGLYWVEKVDVHLNELRNNHPDAVVLVSDVRFVNEVQWVQKRWGGEFIHLKRYKTHYSESPIIVDGISRNDLPIKTYDPAPNEEEAKNDPLIQELADHKIEWESLPNLSSFEPLRQIVMDTLNKTKFFNGKLLP